jgi:hypothetical protein
MGLNPSSTMRVPETQAAPWFLFSGKMITVRQWKLRRGNLQNTLPMTKVSRFPATLLPGR